MNIKKYQWKNRLILVHDTSKDNKYLHAQKEFFAENQQENLDRDLLLLHIPVDESQLINAYQLHSNTLFAMALVGKDGEVKAVYKTPTPMQNIYKIIDSMPMRRQEINKTKD